MLRFCFQNKLIIPSTSQKTIINKSETTINYVESKLMIFCSLNNKLSYLLLLYHELVNLLSSYMLCIWFILVGPQKLGPRLRVVTDLGLAPITHLEGVSTGQYH